MSGKSGDKKLGRNPFDHKRPSRAKRHESATEPQAGIVPEKIQNSSSPQDSQACQDSPGGVIFPSSPAWFFVDLWTGALTEPYFFWAKSMDIMKKSMSL